MVIKWSTIFWFLCAAPFVALLLSLLVNFIVLYAKGRRIRSAGRKQKSSGLFKRVFLDFPKQFWLDRFSLDPDEFCEYGLHMFCGEQGSGKTTAVADLLLKLKKKYGKVKVRTNFNYVGQDGEINNWKQLVMNDNGIYGQIEVIDEIQTWFSTAQSLNFPPDMLKEISQQRKQRKMLIGTAQVFGRISKPIREQTSVVYCPITILGCLTIVRVTKPQYYSEDKGSFKRYIRHYFFIHSDEIRDSFDTYKKIEGMTKEGFIQRPDIYRDAV